MLRTKLDSAARRQDRYLDLVRDFPLRPIRTPEAHRQAKQIYRVLAGETGVDVADYRDVLLGLITDYEQRGEYQLSPARPSAAAVVKHLLAERGMSVNAFAKQVGVAQSALSAMLSGKRDWSKSAIIAVADYFALQPGIFLRSYAGREYGLTPAEMHTASRRIANNMDRERQRGTVRPFTGNPDALRD